MKTINKISPALKYRKNTFFIDESRIYNDAFMREHANDSGEESFPFSSMMNAVPNKDSTNEELDRLVNSYHELNHYLHDLCLFSCITESELNDVLTKYAQKFSTYSDIHYPLMDTSCRELNLHVSLSQDTKQMISECYQLADIYDSIFRKSYHLPHPEEYNLSISDTDVFDNLSLSYNDLLESYAYLKSHFDLFTSVKDEETAMRVHEYLKSKDGAIPIIKKDVYYEYDKEVLSFNRPYEIVRYLFLLCHSSLKWSWDDLQTQYAYYDTEIPKNYIGSEAWNIYIYICFALETALSIPSWNHIKQCLCQNRDYPIEEFSPVHRFFKVLKVITEEGGYPNAVEGEEWYYTFFNWIANACNWNNYDEVYSSIVEWLCSRYAPSHEVVIHKQLEALTRKRNRYAYILYPGWRLIGDVNSPILWRNKNGLSIIVTIHDGNIYIHYTKNIYSSFFSSNIPQNQEIYASDTDKIKAQKHLINSDSFFREACHRMFSHTLFEALFYEKEFSCPMSLNDCPYCRERCHHLKSIDGASPYCQLRILRVNGLQRILPHPIGNVADCMLLNVAYDGHYNVQNLKYKK